MNKNLKLQICYKSIANQRDMWVHAGATYRLLHLLKTHSKYILYNNTYICVCVCLLLFTTLTIWHEQPWMSLLLLYTIVVMHSQYIYVPVHRAFCKNTYKKKSSKPKSVILTHVYGGYLHSLTYKWKINIFLCLTGYNWSYRHIFPLCHHVNKPFICTVIKHILLFSIGIKPAVNQFWNDGIFQSCILKWGHCFLHVWLRLWVILSVWSSQYDATEFLCGTEV